MTSRLPEHEPVSCEIGSRRPRYQTGKHLEAFLLLLVAERPDHGGSLLGRLRDVVPDTFTIDSGQTYRLLRNLERQGILASGWAEPAERGRVPLRIYHLTSLGLEHLRTWHAEIEARHASLGSFLRRFDEAGFDRVEPPCPLEGPGGNPDKRGGL